jgi:Fe-S oxidoreductase
MEDTMCPSYMATKEERHSTRGRARLLFEMLRSDSPMEGGWRNQEVKEALDLCLACKGCKHDCPVRVDMATYKAEFRSHYWAHRLRPLHAYALGLIYWEARLASRMPRLANVLARTEPLASAAKIAVGITPKRKAPAFAPETFTSWFAARTPRRTGERVLLWPDTFTNHFEPSIARAAVEVLEASGFAVSLPSRPLCCGRPLYDYGMLTLARRQLRQTLEVLREEIRAGTPVVALEPSCGAVFRDELPNMLPHDQDAKRLARLTCTLGELLDRRGAEWEPPVLRRHAILHTHCHQKATADVAADERVLERAGVALETLNAGCCGLAGSFGYEHGEPYEVSMKAGERVLLPAVRAAPPESLIVTDGFSCRHQIEHGSERRALHLAQVLHMGLRHGPGGPTQGRPEEAYGPF